MDEYEIMQLTKQFKADLTKLVKSLPETQAAQTIGEQVLLSGKSVEDNYRAAHRARSSKEFISKAGICLEETDTCMRWMELLKEQEVVPAEQLVGLIKKADKLIGLFSASITSARTHSRS